MFLRVCGCWCQGSPLGRGRAVIARSSPGAGYGHPGHVSWVTAKSHGGFPHSVSYSFLPPHTCILPSTLKYADLRLTLLSPELFSSFAYSPSQFVYLPECLSLPLSCRHSVFLCLCRSLSLYLSILARLYFFISCAVGGEWGSPRGRQSTLILIRSRTEQSGGWEL